MIPQQSIAHYRIVSKLGEGGMGEVWRATDTRLNREVAIKVLPEAVADDPDRLARFSREAQVLASLNHPNIAAIYSVEERALVMELVPGATLAGPLSWEQALPLIHQLIDGLEYAHEKGIVHRDLKPANIKVTPEGRLKILDFGLAKALTPEVSSADPANSPTLTMSTMAGVIMGTAGYMAPEQARGQDVDKRADVWAFGVVVYELLTGRQLFSGSTVTDTLASVLTKEIDWQPIPPRVRPLLRHCLERDPKRRLRDIGDARVLLAESSGADDRSLPSANRSLPLWLAALLVIATSVAAAGWWRAGHLPLRPLMRFSIDLGRDAVRGRNVSALISPDGARLVFTAKTEAGVTSLATRPLDQSKTTVLNGAEGGVDPFFSPDSQWVAFFADNKLKKISVQGGAAITICDTSGGPRGGAWGEDDSIIANLDNTHLFRVPSAGGKPEMLTKPENRGMRTDRWPQILPGGSAVLFTSGSTANSGGSGAGYDDANIEVLWLKTREIKTVLRGGFFGRYVPSGHLIYIHQGALFAVPFDPSRLETRGTPVRVVEEIAAAAGQAAGQLDFSQTGTMVYLSGKPFTGLGRLAWMNEGGKIESLITLPGFAITPRLSPDGKLLGVSVNGDIWVHDFNRDSDTRLTFEPSAVNRGPVWTPDGKHLVYGNNAGDIGWIRADGSGKPGKLFSSKDSTGPTSISPDGKYLAFNRVGTSTGFDVWTLPLDWNDPDHPKPGTPEPILHERYNELDAAFSPDGHWVAYTSDESGAGQVFVRPFPAGPAAGRWQISTITSRFPNWSRDGRELFFLNLANGRIMVAGYTAHGDAFVAQQPREWSPTPILINAGFHSFTIAPDARRFVVTQALPQTEEGGTLHVTVLLNFFDELKRRLP